MSDYAPSTDAIRGRIIQRGAGWGFYSLAEFDRFLAEHDRQVAERAWDETVEETHALGWLHDFAKSDALARNPYRAAKGEQK